MTRAFAFAICLLAAGCTDWPDVQTPRPTRATVDWPDLVPIASLPSSPGTETEADDNARLLARANALRARAALLRRPVSNEAAIERLRSRLAR